jgi:hypothetical protein
METGSGLAKDERVVFLVRGYHTGNATEDSFTRCLEKRLSDGGQTIDVYPRGQFMDALFPWFEPRTAPESSEALPELLARPAVARRINDTGVRYIVWLNGDTERVDGGGGISCSVSPAGGGCFGFAWWEKDSSYAASVWDLKNVATSGSVTTQVSGFSMMPAVVIPIPLIAPTQTTACKQLATELREFLLGVP